MKKIFIVVENLRIGGYQRLTLDQAYALSKIGRNVTICKLNDCKQSDENLEIIEKELILKYKIRIVNVFGSRLNQFLLFKNLISSNNSEILFLVHTLRATVLLKLTKIIFRYKIIILTTIHQLPGLSHPQQRMRRYFYAQFADSLYFYSKAAILGWQNEINSNFVMKLIFKKKCRLLRNGVFVDRLEFSKIRIPPNQDYPVRMIFLGRIATWKGLETLFKLAQHPKLFHASILIIVPAIDKNFSKRMPIRLMNRIQIQTGTTINNFVPKPGDVHIYPTNFGKNIKYTESISINCLEMACLGVPSLVTKGGVKTWPELDKFKILIEADWQNFEECVELIIKNSKEYFSSDHMKSIQEIINIENQFQTINQF